MGVVVLWFDNLRQARQAGRKVLFVAGKRWHGQERLCLEVQQTWWGEPRSSSLATAGVSGVGCILVTQGCDY